MSTCGSCSSKNKRKNALGSRTNPNSDALYIGLPFKQNVEQTRRKKKKLNDIVEEEELYEYQERSNRRVRGSKDAFVSRSKYGVETRPNLNDKKEEREKVCQQIARFFYTSAIPFKAVNNPEFSIMVEKIAKFGIGLKPPSYREMKVTFLNKEVKNVTAMFEEFKEEWKRTGCTIMCDGWSGKKRSICNFLVNSRKGTFFLSSVDTSDISKTTDKVYDMLDAFVEKVGPENVVQIVTRNDVDYKAVGEKLMKKRPTLFWTPCAAHCIDLMLEDLGKKLKVHNRTIEKARKITTYIYSRSLLLTWMREFTEGKELIRPAVTRFATSYLTLRCLNEHKGSLIALFASDNWKSSKFSSSTDGKRVQRIVFDMGGFWKGVVTCLRAALPLVKVLRMVDFDENPAIGFIYEAMTQAKNQIKANFNGVEKNYKPVLDIVDEHWVDQLHRPLHAAAYYLNPQYQYSPNFQSNADIKIGLYNCLQRMVPDAEERLNIDLQMDAFRKAIGLFGLDTAILTRTKKAPVDWWNSYGDECPELKRFAMRILNLTCSSSGCERNWSAFEMVHSKKRNRLHQQKMNDLVFVMYNLKLKRRHEKRSSAAVIQSPVVIEDLPSDDEWITEIEDSVLPTDEQWLNALDRAARRFTRGTQTKCDSSDVEFNGIENENVEVQWLSDDEVAAAFDSSEEFDEDDLGSTSTDDSIEFDENFGYDD